MIDASLLAPPSHCVSALCVTRPADVFLRAIHGTGTSAASCPLELTSPVPLVQPAF